MKMPSAVAPPPQQGRAFDRLHGLHAARDEVRKEKIKEMEFTTLEATSRWDGSRRGLGTPAVTKSPSHVSDSSGSVFNRLHQHGYEKGQLNLQQAMEERDYAACRLAGYVNGNSPAQQSPAQLEKCNELFADAQRLHSERKVAQEERLHVQSSRADSARKVDGDRMYTEAMRQIERKDERVDEEQQRLREEAAELRAKTAVTGRLPHDRRHLLHDKAVRQQEKVRGQQEERRQRVEYDDSGVEHSFSPRITKMAKSIGGHVDLPFRQ